MNRKIWTSQETEKLIKLYSNTSNNILCHYFNTTITRIYRKANSLGLKKSDKYYKQYGGGRIKKGEKIGLNTTFKKGSIPFNKGKKWKDYMSAAGQKSALKTTYKKNNLPHNTKHNGYLSIRKDNKANRNYVFIRVSLSKWMLYHRYLYIKKYGEIPTNSLVIFKDGNTLNFKLSNLLLLKKAENMLRNTIHRYPLDLQKAIKFCNKLNNKINELNKNII